MKVDKIWLERKISELNHWLNNTPKTHFEYAFKTQNRNYYVKKIIELEENNLSIIKV